MSRKRQGLRAQDRTFNHITRTMAREANESRLKTACAALQLCLTEIEQFHSRAYPECTGGCPAHEAMDAAKKALSCQTKST